MNIQNYDDFISTLLNAGFSMSGGKTNDIYSVYPFAWNVVPTYTTHVRWHTGNQDTDPWEWRMRVLNERKDIAYSKVFFNRGGYITKEWYPYFLAVRRGTMVFEEEYFNGTVSQYAKRIYEIISNHESIPLHLIKQLAGFGKEYKTKFDRALIELQMKMYITICGQQKKTSQMGLEYGWASTVFCTVEKFWDNDIFEKVANISEQDAFEKIRSQIIKLNPEATQTKISKFIKG